MPCCDQGGCWKARTVALGDGDEKDHSDQLCVNVVDGRLPRCIDMISAREVIERIELYFDGGLLPARATRVDASALAERLALEINGDLDHGLFQETLTR